MYKLLTKLLVNRLKPFLPAMNHPSQSGFVHGRRATDNYIVTQEMIHYISQRKDNINLMATKIDLEKAYDKLEWPFIKYTLQFYHFPAKIVDLIMACISSSTISILWNGKASIRQGNPLSPYVFILCLNQLSLTLDQTLHSK